MTAAAIADDLTGALEIGALLAAAGLRAWVTTRWPNPLAATLDATIDALVIDTETRSLPGPEAAARVRTAAACLNAKWLYQKTDSTLRGPIAAELAALGAHRPVVFAPAYPRLGRTLHRGILYVDGVPVSQTAFAADPRHPVRQSDVLALLHGSEFIENAAALASRLDQHHGPPLAEDAPEILVCDARTDAELAAIADVLRSRPPVICAGSGGFAAHWITLLPGLRTPPAPRPALRQPLLVCGSRHPASRRQAEAARAGGIRTIMPPKGHTGHPAEIVQALAEEAARDACGDLILFGGDTAYAVLQRLGEHDLQALGEILPGVPLSRTRSGRLLVTKAGGFGEDDVVRRILTSSTDPLIRPQP